MNRQWAADDIRRSRLNSRLDQHMELRDHRRFDDLNLAARTLRTTSFVRRPGYLRSSYYDRPDLIVDRPHHVYSYYDLHHRLSYRIISPSYYFWVGYRFGPHLSFRYVYPYYHRKYVFISLGGYWPLGYTYLRYYWYGWHPYLWYV